MPSLSTRFYYTIQDLISPPTEPGAQWRERAASEATLRSAALQRSQEAWAAKDGAESKRWSDIGKAHGREMEAYNTLASQAIFEHKNGTASASALATIDLHGLYVNEAIERASAHLTACRKAGVRRTTIITGRGKGSVDGIPKLKGAILGLLVREKGVTVEEDSNPGAVVVLLDGSSMEDDGGWVDVMADNLLWVLGGTIKSIWGLLSTLPESTATRIAYQPRPLITGILGKATASPAPPGGFTKPLPAASEGEDDDWEVITAPTPRPKKRQTARKPKAEAI